MKSLQISQYFIQSEDTCFKALPFNHLPTLIFIIHAVTVLLALSFVLAHSICSPFNFHEFALYTGNSVAQCGLYRRSLRRVVVHGNSCSHFTFFELKSENCASIRGCYGFVLLSISLLYILFDIAPALLILYSLTFFSLLHPTPFLSSPASLIHI